MKTPNPASNGHRSKGVLRSKDKIIPKILDFEAAEGFSSLNPAVSEETAVVLSSMDPAISSGITPEKSVVSEELVSSSAADPLEIEEGGSNAAKISPEMLGSSKIGDEKENTLSASVKIGEKAGELDFGFNVRIGIMCFLFLMLLLTNLVLISGISDILSDLQSAGYSSGLHPT